MLPNLHKTPARHLRVRVVSVALCLALLLAGCWPFPSDETPQSTSTPQPGSPGGRANELNIAGGIEDPPTLDPALATDAYSHFVIRQIFSGLVAFDDELNVVPDIAAAMPSVSSDGKTYTFVLRRGVLFSDGTELTSADFKYSMERAADPKLAGAQPATSLPAGLYLDDIVGVKEKLEGKATEIAGITTPDPYTLEITIDAPKSYFLSKLTSGPAFVVQRANVEKGAAWTEDPVGTGPFKLDKWIRHQHMVLVPNERYYGEPAKLNVVNIWMGANATGTLQQYERQNSSLDVTDVYVDDIERVADRNNPLSKELHSVPDLSVTYLGFNVRHKPFDDPKVREALARAIDRQKIARVMFQSRVRQANGFVPPEMADYVGPNVDTGYDVSRARQLIAESSYKDVKNLPKLRLYTSGASLGVTLREVYSQTLGLDVEVYEIEWSEYLEGLDRGDYPMFLLSWIADFPDPEAILGSLFRSTSPANHMGYRNADVDAALSAAATETDITRRMATYAQIEERVLKDYPAVPLYHSVSYTLVKPYVEGLTITPMGILSLKDVRVLDH